LGTGSQAGYRTFNIWEAKLDIFKNQVAKADILNIQSAKAYRKSLTAPVPDRLRQNLLKT